MPGIENAFCDIFYCNISENWIRETERLMVLTFLYSTISLSVSLSLCFFPSLFMYGYLPSCMCVSVPICLLPFLSFCLFHSLFVCIPLSLSFCLSVSLPSSINVSFSHSYSVFVPLPSSLSPSVRLSVSLFLSLQNRSAFDVRAITLIVKS